MKQNVTGRKTNVKQSPGPAFAGVCCASGGHVEGTIGTPARAPAGKEKVVLEGFIMTGICALAVLAYGSLVWIVTKRHS